MTHVLLIQLPIPRLNFGKKTGNIPLGAACLKQAADGIPGVSIEILPESLSSYMGDQALINLIIDIKPDILGLTLFSWNVERSLYVAAQVKKVITCKVVAGGPEVTEDNSLIHVDTIDTRIYGEGEQAFINYLNNCDSGNFPSVTGNGECLFTSSPSPYLLNLLEPHIENLMLLETQRGCPYQCGFCYYNKARGGMSYKETPMILDGVRWAVENKIEELYLLDPSLNARKDLKDLLVKIAEINTNRTVAINSEIRAEWIDEEMADLFQKAGFTGFEIGLQTTNKRALKIMNRPTDLNKFLNGAILLKDRDILPRIDLITGLPGDYLEGFNRSIGFVAENNLQDDVQVFPLSVLPGTTFRKNSRELNLIYDPKPPYTIIETDTFSSEDMMLSFDYAESLFDVALFPLPELNVSWKRPQSDKDDVKLRIGKLNLITKVFVDSYRPLKEIEQIAGQLSSPYQIYITSKISDMDYVGNVLSIITQANPFSPFEMIFMEPSDMPDTKRLLSQIQLKRPHYLDNDLRYLYAEVGNRAVQFTVVSKLNETVFSGDMRRQVYLWTENRLPEPSELDDLGDFEGVLIDSSVPADDIRGWQAHFSRSVNYIPQISFTRLDDQKNWLRLILEDEYCFDFLEFY